MSVQTLIYLKTKFENGDTPTEQDFIDLLDSFRHKNDQIPINEINNSNGQLTLTIVPVNVNNGTCQWNHAQGKNAVVYLTHTIQTFTLVNMSPHTYFTLMVKQNSAGGKAIAAPNGGVPNKVSPSGNGAFGTTSMANAVDIWSGYFDGTNIYWTRAANFT